VFHIALAAIGYRSMFVSIGYRSMFVSIRGAVMATAIPLSKRRPPDDETAESPTDTVEQVLPDSGMVA
jgi:hypothetical protein